MKQNKCNKIEDRGKKQKKNVWKISGWLQSPLRAEEKNTKKLIQIKSLQIPVRHKCLSNGFLFLLISFYFSPLIEEGISFDDRVISFYFSSDESLWIPEVLNAALWLSHSLRCNVTYIFWNSLVYTWHQRLQLFSYEYKIPLMRWFFHEIQLRLKWHLTSHCLNKTSGQVIESIESSKSTKREKKELLS